MQFAEIPEFNKDFKNLYKRYKSLHDDLALRKKVLELFPLGRGNDVDQIPGLKIKNKVYKARLMCRTIKRESLQLIYCYEERSQRITLIEIYLKGDQQNEDKDRIHKYFL
jgi:hypothetical protein